MAKRRVLQYALVLTLLTTAAAGLAQQPFEYVIGPGDVLSISVWRHPDLDREVVVRSNGMMTFPPVGELKAAGLTPSELSRELMQRLRDYTRETTQVTVSMAQFNSRAVFLTGQVTAPGRYSFETIPDILQLLSQAGGALPGADLSNVSIVRPSATGPEVIRVDVAAYMRGQSTAPLPALRPGDTIDVPPLALGGALSGPGLVYVFGEVNTPGAYPTNDALDLFQVLAMAGGTTPEAEIAKVSVVMNAGDGQVVASVDLKRVMREGAARPFLIRPGDRVFVPASTSNIVSQTLSVAGAVLGYTRDVLSSYLLYLTVDRELDEAQQRDAAARAAAEAAGVTP
jgi:polysaccharide export outer membrane protein